ncbi:MAG: enoyl-CoA hydratase [Gammaproteobacteria bacterium]|nr:enoyl-CoA hydratase [Gammaproteobacteria bacterium]
MTHLIETFDDGIATLTMNRPEARNALSPSMMAGLQEAIPRLAQDPNVRLVVLTGAGGAFCAGGDVKGFAGAAKQDTTADTNFEQRVQSLRLSMEISRWLHEMPKPTLAVIGGPAAGGGLSFALACDLRIAIETAKFTTAFAKIGLSGDYGGCYFLPHLIGAAKAKELYFTADVIDAATALRLGIVNQVFAADEFVDAAGAYARRLADLPTLALGYMKKNLNAAEQGSLAHVLDLEAQHVTRTFLTEDHKLAAQAFVDKRTPEFKGR